MNTISPITPNGWSSESVPLSGDTLKYVRAASVYSGYMKCQNCGQDYEEGQIVIIVRDYAGKRRAAYCSTSCQRQGFFEGIAKKRLGAAYYE